MTKREQYLKIAEACFEVIEANEDKLFVYKIIETLKLPRNVREIAKEILFWAEERINGPYYSWHSFTNEEKILFLLFLAEIVK